MKYFSKVFARHFVAMCFCVAFVTPSALHAAQNNAGLDLDLGVVINENSSDKIRFRVVWTGIGSEVEYDVAVYNKQSEEYDTWLNKLTHLCSGSVCGFTHEIAKQNKAGQIVRVRPWVKNVKGQWTDIIIGNPGNGNLTRRVLRPDGQETEVVAAPPPVAENPSEPNDPTKEADNVGDDVATSDPDEDANNNPVKTPGVGSRVFNVKQLGINEAIRSLQNAGGGTLWFPKGEYHFTGQLAGKTELNLFGLSNVTIAGEGDDSVLYLADTGRYRQVRILTIYDSKNITIENLRFEGNRHLWKHLEERHEHQSNIFIRQSENIDINNVSLNNAFGDGINIGDVEDVDIDSVSIKNSARNGITIGHGVTKNVVIQNNYFGPGIDTQQIDLEHGTSSELTIKNNLFMSQSPIDSVQRDQFAVVLSDTTGVTVEDNEIHGPVLLRNAANTVISKNNGVKQLTIDRQSTNVKILDNNFDLESTPLSQHRGWPSILVRQVAGLYPTDIEFSRNHIDVGKSVTEVALMTDVRQLKVVGNEISGHANVSQPFTIHAQSTSVRVTESNNRISYSNRDAQPLDVNYRQTGANKVDIQ